METENNHIEVNGTEYGFSIEPHYGKVLVEIYKLSPHTKSHIHLLSRKFGRFYRKPIESDYINGREWADLQMRSILNGNRK